MIGEYWIDKKENNGRNSFFKMLDGIDLNDDEKTIYRFMQKLQRRYENIVLPPLSRLDVRTMETHFSNASEKVLEALMKCCVLTNTFVPIKDITVGKYKSSLSYAQRFAMWKGAEFKGIDSYGESFIEEVVSKEKSGVENLFDLHQQMNVKGFSVRMTYLTLMMKEVVRKEKSSIWTSSDKQAEQFCQQVYEEYPQLQRIMRELKEGPRKVSHASIDFSLRKDQQKTL